MEKNYRQQIDRAYDTQEQEFYYTKMSRTVGHILRLLESALPEGRQLKMLKKNVEDRLYETRNDLDQLDNIYEETVESFTERFEKLSTNIMSFLDIAFPEGRQLSTLKELVNNRVTTMRDELISKIC